MTFAGQQLQLWPVHLQPFEDELLSSWIVRLAHGNGFKAQTFAHGYFESGRNFWIGDIDRSWDDVRTQVLVEKTGQGAAKIASLLLRRYEGQVFEDISSKGHVNWLLQLGLRGRSFKRPGLMFCPACFRDSDEPYLRGHWRLAWSTVCIKHSRLLFDRCPQCGNPLQPHLSDRKYRTRLTSMTTIATCCGCALDLRRWETYLPANEESLKRQAQWELASKLGYLRFGNSDNLQSLLYFNGLRLIAQSILSELSKGPEVTEKFRVLERMPVHQRNRLMGKLWDLLSDWPERFVSHFSARSSPYTKLVGSRIEAPWWLHVVCRDALQRGYMLMSPYEVAYIRNSITVGPRNGELQSARKSFGRDISKHVSLKRTSVAVASAYQLFSHIDQLLANQSIHAAERYSLQRDKTMLLVGHGQNKSQSDLRKMPLADLAEGNCRVVPEPDLEFPLTEQQLTQWLSWYVHTVRAGYFGQRRMNNLFLTTTAHPMSESLIGQRLMKHFHMSGVISSFPTYAIWRNAVLLPNEVLQIAQKTARPPSFQ